MGMDVYGEAPTSSEGEYFRRNVWGWRRLADLVCDVAPNITSACKHWQSNDGDGLGADDAVRLADALQAALDDGRVAAWITACEAAAAVEPNRGCTFCNSTGIRTDDVGTRMKMPERVCGPTTPTYAATIPHPRAGQTGWCNGCDGRGWNEAWAKAYGVEADDVRDFIKFIRASGGFKIC